MKTVLYADDDADDKFWVMEACKAIQLTLKIDFVENGRKVLNYLSVLQPGHFPSLIVLDLNMPEMDGRQTLKKIKDNKEYENIPVVIVTTSSSKSDIEICKRLGASLFLVKPDTYQDWQRIVSQFLQFVH